MAKDDLKLKAEQLIDEAWERGVDEGKQKSTLHCWTTKEIEAYEEVYQRGYEDGVEHTAEEFKYEISNTGLYQCGLKDAWECARKLLKYKTTEIMEIFGLTLGDGSRHEVIQNYPVYEAMKKIKDYERKQKWAEQAKRGKEHRDKIEKMLEKRQTEKNCHTCALNYRFCEINRCKDGNNRLLWQPKQEEQQDEDKPKCDTCEFEGSQFNPCNGCVDNDEYAPKQTKDDYVDAIVKVRVPKWQIGEKVNLYFKDTMSIDGICERKDK